MSPITSRMSSERRYSGAASCSLVRRSIAASTSALLTVTDSRAGSDQRFTATPTRRDSERLCARISPGWLAEAPITARAQPGHSRTSTGLPRLTMHNAPYALTAARA